MVRREPWPDMLSWCMLAALTAVWEMCKVAGQLQCVGAGGDSNAAARALLQASCPMFEAFWQGRLIPGARIDSLPFVEVRQSCNFRTRSLGVIYPCSQPNGLQSKCGQPNWVQSKSA